MPCCGDCVSGVLMSGNQLFLKEEIGNTKSAFAMNTEKMVVQKLLRWYSSYQFKKKSAE
jgi:hypothetical protein